jgi:hypothetical protein
MRRFFARFFSFFSSRRAMLALIATQQREIALRECAVNYVTVAVPTKEQINSRLALFRDGKGEDIYRGGLRVVSQIKSDINRAAVDARKKAKANGQV